MRAINRKFSRSGTGLQEVKTAPHQGSQGKSAEKTLTIVHQIPSSEIPDALAGKTIDVEANLFSDAC